MRCVLAIIALVVCLVLPPAARAQTEPYSAVATQGDFTLGVRDEDQNLCLQLETGGQSRSNACGPRPEGRSGGRTVDAGGVLGGVVPADTAEVEIELPDGSRARTATVAGEAYRGSAAGAVRFFLLASPGGESAPAPVVLRRFGADGQLVGAFGGNDVGAPVAGPVRLLSRGAGSSRLRVEVFGVRTFEPSLLRIDRTGRAACLSADQGGGASVTCLPQALATPPLTLEASRGCGRAGTLVTGLGGDAHRVVLVLGSGRRVSAPTRELPADIGPGLRAFVAVTPAREAVRRAVFFDASGRRLRHQDLFVPPTLRPCRGGFSVIGFGTLGLPEDDDRGGSGPSGQVAAGAAPDAQLLVRDEGDFLCLGVGDLRADRADCRIPFADAEYPLAALSTETAGGRSAVGGAVLPGVARVVVEFGEGRRVPAVLTDGQEYSGATRGLLRFFVADAPGTDAASAIELFGQDGRRIARLPLFAGPDLSPVVVLRERKFRLFAAAFRFEFQLGGRPTERFRSTCTGILFGSQKATIERCLALDDPIDDAFGFVSCSPRVAVLYGRVRAGGRGVAAILADGRVFRPRLVRLPRHLGGARLWVLRIPRSARVVRIRRLGRIPKPRFGPKPKRTSAYRLPPPARQCGYAAPDLEG